jgi:hypothetical protein
LSTVVVVGAASIIVVWSRLGDVAVSDVSAVVKFELVAIGAVEIDLELLKWRAGIV